MKGDEAPDPAFWMLAGLGGVMMAAAFGGPLVTSLVLGGIGSLFLAAAIYALRGKR